MEKCLMIYDPPITVTIFSQMFTLTKEWKFKGDAMTGDHKARRLHKKQRNKGGKLRRKKREG